MAGQYDPRQQRPATPPQWQQAAPRRDYQQPQPQFQAPRQYQQPPPQPYMPPPPQLPSQSAPPRGNAAKGCATLGCGGLAAVVILVAVVASHGSSSGSPAASSGPQQGAAPAQQAPAGPQTVTYVVTGSPADVTYGPAGSDYSGGVPMKVTKPLGSPSYYAVNAQLQGSGTVSCEIEVDGKVVSSGSASGGYNIADCEIVQDPLSGSWENTNG